MISNDKLSTKPMYCVFIHVQCQPRHNLDHEETKQEYVYTFSI